MATVDIVGAVISRLLATSAVTALTSQRISGTRQDAWALPVAAVVVDGPRGGPGEIGSGLMRERLDVTCFGSTGLNAKTVSQTVLDALIPPNERSVSFTAANTRVHSVMSEAGRIFLADPDTGWPYVVIPLMFTYSRTAVAA